MSKSRRKFSKGVSAVRRMRFSALALVCVFFSFASGFAGESEHVFALREHLDRTWRDQMLTYSFEAEPGTCHPGSIRLKGPEGPVTVQLSNVETYEGTPFVRRADVSFYVRELPPLATQQYVLQYNQHQQDDPVAVGLSIEIDGSIVQVENERFGARMLLGEEVLDEPAPTCDVPAPLQAVRLIDGTWTGRGTLYGDAKVVSYASSLTAAGPVFAELETIYRFDDGNKADYRFRIPAGDRVVEIDTRSYSHRPDAGWELILGGDGIGFSESILVSFRSYRARETPVHLTPSDRPFAELAPWAGSI